MSPWEKTVKIGIAALLGSVLAVGTSNAQDVREVDVVVRDSYTLESLEGVVVNALQDGRIVGTGISNEEGVAYLDLSLSSREGFMLSNAYPNPAKNNAKFDLVVESTGTNRVELYNILGQRVFSQEEHLSKGSYTLDFQGLERIARGQYFLVLSNDAERKVESFIVSGSNNVYHGSPSLSTSFNPVPRGFEHDTYFVLSRQGYERKEKQANLDDRLTLLMDKQNNVNFESDSSLVRVTGGSFDEEFFIPAERVLPSGSFTIWNGGSSYVVEVKSDTTLYIGRKE